MAQAAVDPAISDSAPPTETAPEVGVIAIGVGNRSVEISEIEHWVEDDLHVFRSVEFDCVAEHEDEWCAVEVFLHNAEDLLRFLDDLVDAGRATDHEVRTLAKLSRRFYEVYSVQREELLRRKRRLLMRSRDIHSPNWQRRPTPASSSAPVPA